VNIILLFFESGFISSRLQFLFSINTLSMVLPVFFIITYSRRLTLVFIYNRHLPSDVEGFSSDFNA